MVSLVRTKEEIKERNKQFKEEPADFEVMPVSMHLGDIEVEKLKLSGVKVGQEMRIVGTVKVHSVSASDSVRGRKHRSVTLDVVDMDIRKGSAADQMFGEEE